MLTATGQKAEAGDANVLKAREGFVAPDEIRTLGDKLFALPKQGCFTNSDRGCSATSDRLAGTAGSQVGWCRWPQSPTETYRVITSRHSAAHIPPRKPGSLRIPKPRSMSSSGTPNDSVAPTSTVAEVTCGTGHGKRAGSDTRQVVRLQSERPESCSNSAATRCACDGIPATLGSDMAGEAHAPLHLLELD